MECSVAIQVLPMDAQGNEEVVRIVDEAIACIAQSGLSYFVGPFETVIEGSFGTCMNVVKTATQACEQAGSKHVMCYVKIDYTPGADVLSTEEKIGKYTAANEESYGK